MTHKLCKDCAHYLESPYGESFDKCLANIKPGVFTLVRGESIPSYADLNRASADKCGVEAKQFKPRAAQ